MERKPLIERLIHAVDLDGEPVPGRSLIEIIGNNSVLIENHCGVVAYSKQVIRVKTKCGMICISGANLSLMKMSKELLRICGAIKSIELQGRG